MPRFPRGPFSPCGPGGPTGPGTPESPVKPGGPVVVQMRNEKHTKLLIDFHFLFSFYFAFMLDIYILL